MEMVARWTAAFILALSLVSCEGFFDSYFPNSVEYLETQTDMAAQWDHKPVESVQMTYLEAGPSHSKGLLVVLVFLSDGDIRVLFYDPQNLKLLKAHDRESLRAANMGTDPILGLVGQDGGLIYTGTLAYDGTSLEIAGTGNLPTYLTVSIGMLPNLSQYRLVYDKNADQAFLFRSDAGSYMVSTTVPAIDSPSLAYPAAWNPPALGPMMLNVQYTAGQYLAIVSWGAKIGLARAGNPYDWATSGTYVELTPENYPQYDSSFAWATNTAAVLRSHGDNANLFTAYSWSGSELGAVGIADNDQTIAATFAPDGKTWFLFESSTGKLSREKAWW